MLSNKLNNPLFIGFYLLALLAGSNFIKIEVGNYHLFVGRILTFILPLLLITKDNLLNFKKAKYVKLLALVIFVVLGWSALSIIWAKDKTAVYVNCFYMISGVLSGLNLVLLAFDSNFKITANFIKGWHISWLGLVIFGYLEILFNFHIQGHFSDFLQKQSPGIPAFDSVISLFDGPNEFATYLVTSIPFSIYFFKKKPIIFFGILLISFQFIYRNDAKFCLIAFVLFLISFISVYRDSLKNFLFPKFKKYLVYTILLASFLTTILITNKLVENKSENYSIYSSFESNINGLQLDHSGASNQNVLPSMTSFEIRWNLILNGCNFLLKHPLTGIGAGNFEYYMSTEKDLLPTKFVLNSHSWFIQTFSENGIIVGGFYWLVLLVLFISNFKYLFFAKDVNIQKFLTINLLLTFAIISNVSSSFASSSLNWSILCILFIAFQGNEERNEIT